MKVPADASGVRVAFGEVYIESPSYPEDERDTWTVWDPRPVRQGARLVESGLTFWAATKIAKTLQASGGVLCTMAAEAPWRAELHGYDPQTTLLESSQSSEGQETPK